MNHNVFLFSALYALLSLCLLGFFDVMLILNLENQS